MTPDAAVVTLDDLPLDALALVAGCLSEMELFRLSHVSSELLRALSRDALWRDMELKQQEPQTAVQRWFAPTRDPERRVSAKEDVMRHRALLFSGDRMDDTDAVGRVPDEHHAFAFANTAFQRPPPQLSVVKKQQSRPSDRHQRRPREQRRPVAKNLASAFSFELWFSVDTIKDPVTQRQGGVLFGAQSKPFTTPATSFFYQQFAMVDPSLKLYCSLRKNEDKTLLAMLETDRWYHLVLVNEAEREVVYLDGRVVSVVNGPLSAFFWSQYAHCQVGTGLVRHKRHESEPGVAAMNAARSRIGWYNFHGVVDTFRAYDHALSKSAVQNLAQGCVLTASPSKGTAPVFSMRKELLALRGEAATTHCYVRCTRPQDGKFERL